MKKVLVIGGTGALGTYAVPELLKKGYKVDVCTLDHVTSDNPNLRYIVGNMYDMDTLKKTLAEGYDGIIDYMIYNGNNFRDRYRLFLENTGHYVYLSSYRIYAGEYPINESSARLLDVADDPEYLARIPSEYSLYKARGEDILRNSPYRNYTIVRPSITFSRRRFQLTTLEAGHFVGRAFEGKTVLVPHGAMDTEATLTWAGDSARFFAAVLMNEKAFGEAYTFGTAEHHTWREMAEYYRELIGLHYVEIDDEDYLAIISPDAEGRRYCRWQLIYDREFNRVIDNRKILDLAGLTQEDLAPTKVALKRELDALPRDAFIKSWPDFDQRVDDYIAAHGLS